MISHSAINSPVFVLLETYVFDISFEDDGYSLKIELFQNVNRSNQFRCLFWQIETIEVGANVFDGEEFRKFEATYQVMVNWAAYLSSDYNCFEAKSSHHALELILSDIRRYLVHTSNKEE